MNAPVDFQCVLAIASVGDKLVIVSGLMAIFSAIIACLAYLNSERTLTYHHLTKLVEDFSDFELSKCIKELWEDKHKCNANNQSIAKMYAELIPVDESASRRLKMVSGFYQRMAALCNGGLLSRRVLYSIWTEHDLGIISEILLPIERELYSVSNGGNVPPGNYGEHLVKLQENAAKESKRVERKKDLARRIELHMDRLKETLSRLRMPHFVQSTYARFKH